MMNRPNINVTQSSKIFIGNLPIDKTEAELEIILSEAFSPFGEIVDLFLVRDKNTGSHRGFGFICFTTADEACNALALNGKTVFENYTKPLKVDPAKERRQGAPHENAPAQMLHHQTMRQPYPNGGAQPGNGYHRNPQYQGNRYNSEPWRQQPYWDKVDN